jgi:hypothetical protein
MNGKHSRPRLGLIGCMRRLLALSALGALSSISLAQTPNMNDFECRNAITEALASLRHASDNRLDVFSMVLKMDTTEQMGPELKAYTTYLSYYDDLANNTEIVQAEMLNYSKDPDTGVETLIQRIAADGRRVWAYDAQRNEYSIQHYSAERNAQRAQTYRPDFFNLFRAPVKGQPLDMVTLLNQAAGEVPRARDWVGVVSYSGFDNNDPMNPIRQVWQTTPDGSRTVKYFMSKPGGSTWKIDSVEVSRTQ